MRTKIIVYKSEPTTFSIQESIGFNYEGNKLNCFAQGEVSCVETEGKYVFIIGYIQDNDFINSKEQASYFEEEAAITEQIKKFNGQFSIICVSKIDDTFTIYSNKSGGSRVYFRKVGATWEISNKLKNLISPQDTLNKTALKEEFLYRWVSGDQSLINNIYQTPPGHYWQVQNRVVLQKKRYYEFPEPLENLTSNTSLEEYTAKAKLLLSQSLKSSLKSNKKIAILLSGGIDSSILAAIANECGHNIVAISHRSLQHENPELETAIQFAQTLKIEHRIIDVDDSEIAFAFKECTEIMEQAPRNQSSIILFLIFAKLKDEFSQVVYGEAADTLFGNNLLKQYIARYNKQRKAKKITNKIPLFNILNKVTPQKSKLNTLLNETVKSYLSDTYQLALNQHSIESLNHLLSLSKDENSFYDLKQTQSPKSDLLTDLLKIKRFTLKTSVYNHFHETGTIAAHFGLELVSPFVDINIINFAAQLPLNYTVGCEYIKPILRKIGKQYFEPQLMYLPKKGFPAPHLKWLETCLKPDVTSGLNQFNIRSKEHIDTETQWTSAALSILLNDLKITP